MQSGDNAHPVARCGSATHPINRNLWLLCAATLIAFAPAPAKVAGHGLAPSGAELGEFLVALFFLGAAWNFLFTDSTTLSWQTFTAVAKDRAQGALNFFVFATTAVSSFASGVLVTTQGWQLLNLGSSTRPEGRRTLLDRRLDLSPIAALAK